MKLIFLGSGSAFTVGADNFQSNMLLVNNQGKKLLIDCGSDIRFSLHSVELSHLDITDIYISHLHNDHVGGLEYIGFSTKFDSRCNKPNLYLSKELASALWHNTLSGGMRYIEKDIAELETYFHVKEIAKDNFFRWEAVEFLIVPNIHIRNGHTMIPSYGLIFEINKVKIFITTDTQFCPNEVAEFYNQADIIFHDCETSKVKSSIHAHYDELLTLSEDVRQKMWLYHYQKGLLPNAQQDGFRGFVKRGQVFDFSNPDTL